MNGSYVATQLNNLGVQLFTTGPDVSSGWFAMKCPYCPDEGHHLVVSDDSGGWHCWRCGEKGRPERLLRRFGIKIDFIPSDGIRELDLVHFLRDLFELRKELPSKPTVDEEAVFNDMVRFTRLFSPTYPCNRNPSVPPVVFEYLENRGLSDFEMQLLNIHYSSEAFMAFRAIIPVVYQGRYVNYLGRDITGRSTARYKFCAKTRALLPFSSLIWNYDILSRKEVDTLYICEGVFDSIAFGIEKSTCCFQAFLSPLQVLLLKSLKVGEFRIIFDKGALSKAIQGAERLSLLHSNVSVWFLDEDVGDPGSVSNPEKHINLLARM